jgi:hypothetical protein
MHDLDPRLDEYQDEMDEAHDQEAPGAAYGSELDAAELDAAELDSSELEASEELELASELVSAGNAAELYEAVRKATQKKPGRGASPRQRAASAARRTASRSSARHGAPQSQREGLLERLLIALARRALPTAVHLVLPGVRGTLTAQLSSSGGGAGSSKGAAKAPEPDRPEPAAPADDAAPPPTPGEVFGAELDEMNDEDRSFEAGVRFARFAHEAAQQLEATPASVPDDVAVRTAAVRAAEQHAPGLLRETNAHPNRPHTDAGRWVRVGHQITLYGV